MTYLTVPAGALEQSGCFRKRLSLLIDTFRHTSSVQTSEEVVDVDILSLIREAIDLFSASPEGRRLRVNVVQDIDKGGETWRGYPRQMTQVLLNLLSNAERHAYEGRGGIVELRLRGRSIAGAPSFSLALSDFGAGIAETDLPRVFDPFFTTDRSRRSLGLGLTVVRNIATQSFGGSVRCESRRGQGTTFYVNFSNVRAGALTSDGRRGRE